MMRSMYAGVSGLKVHQTKMDVLGNNISNVNTVGYKGSRATFKSMLSQTIKGASAPQGGRGGTNPQQVGLGAALGSIDTDTEQGNLQSTGKNTDIALQGNGYFVVNDGSQNVYTRAGNMTFDEEGYLTHATTGYRIQGWTQTNYDLENPSAIDTSTTEDIQLQQTMEPEKTSFIDYAGNLNSAAENELALDSQKFEVSDGSGTTDMINVGLSKTDNFNEWDFNLTGDSVNTGFEDPSNPGTYIDQFSGKVTLDDEGGMLSLEDSTGNDITSGDISLDLTGDGSEDTTIDLTHAVGDSIDSDSLFEGSNTTEGVAASYTQNAERKFTTDIFDSQGKQHTVSLTADKIGTNSWTIKNTDATRDVTNADSVNFSGGSDFDLNFNTDGSLIGSGEVELNFTPTGGAGAQTVNLDFSELTQYAGDMTAEHSNYDGYSEGSLQSFSIDKTGTLTGSFDNGYNKKLAMIAVGTCSNPAGLSRIGDTLFRESNNSGDMSIGLADSEGRGEVSVGNLEMSNVDLAKQFTEMITAQRGFQANSKIITTSDQMLQDLVNLKR